jgi:hypothetical protein
LIISSSLLPNGSSPIIGLTSEKVDMAREVGEETRGSRLLKMTKEVLGCLRAAERKAESGRRKDTRFSGEPFTQC